MEADQAAFWYKGELVSVSVNQPIENSLHYLYLSDLLSFFFVRLTCTTDNYVIPLAKKLNDCGVFGVTSDESLNYARANREEWEAEGIQLVAEMVEELLGHIRNNTGKDEQYQSSGVCRDVDPLV